MNWSSVCQCDAGEQCAVRKGSRFGKLCSCPGGTSCSFSILKCLWKHLPLRLLCTCCLLFPVTIVTCFIKLTHKINACIFVIISIFIQSLITLRACKTLNVVLLFHILVDFYKSLQLHDRPQGGAKGMRIPWWIWNLYESGVGVISEGAIKYI